MTTYAERLRDPRWQQKRLKIMERDGWCCRRCYDSTSTFNVHHCYYEAGRDPWDYPDASLLTLCESCHAVEHDSRKEADRAMATALRRGGATSDDVARVARALTAIAESGVVAMEPDWDVLAFTLFLLAQPDRFAIMRKEFFDRLAARQAEEDRKGAQEPPAP